MVNVQYTPQKAMDSGDSFALADADRRLALAYVPRVRRAAVHALWQLDATFASILRTGRDPMLNRIKLAWWREALERLDHEPAPAQPVLAAVEQHVIRLGVSGSQMAAMEEGWALLAEPGALGDAELDGYAAARGEGLFAATAQLLGAELPPDAEAAGQGWALADLARHSGRSNEAVAALAGAERRLRSLSLRWPTPLRPLGMLAVLAARDARTGKPGEWEQPGAPGRMLRMLRYRLTGA